MALRYTSDELLHLKNSPLCVKPSSLPPAEEWMGPPPDNFRNSQGSKTTNDRTRQHDTSFLDQSNRRTGAERHVSRNSANPEDIILGPPRTMFNSTMSRTAKPSDDDKGATRDGDNRFSFRTRNSELDSNDRFRDRDGRNNFRRRGDGEDSDGWSTVKPRKSFGAEGAERFQSRLGDRRPRDSEDRDSNTTTDRPRRNFGEFTREKEGDDNDKTRRNGLNRNRSDLPWGRENNATDAPQLRERFDRSKSWREKADDTNQLEAQRDRPKERQFGRWDRDRDQRQEREPEWLDEPYEDQSQAHTQEDFKKFMESMKNKTAAKAEAALPSKDNMKSEEKAEADAMRPKSMKSTPAIELGPDKFFAAFGQKPVPEIKQDNAAINEAATPVPKGSRFQNFFSSQEEARRQPEPPAPQTAPPSGAPFNPLLALAGISTGSPSASSDSSEKVAFQALLQKLQKQNLQASTPPSGGFAEPPPSHEYHSKNLMASPGLNQPYGQEREFNARPPPQAQEIHAPRPQLNTQFMSAMRPEHQMLHDLIGQRHSSQNSSGSRGEQLSSRNSNPNTEFLVSLMQGGRGGMAEPQREQPVMRMPQPSRPAQIPPTPDREPDFHHERGSSQHQLGGGRPGGIAGFFDEPPMHRREPEARPQQPTHILQRPGPPGLEQMPPSWMQNAGQQLPTPGGGRPMIPPPGLPGAQRSGPMPGNYPNYPMGGYPPPEIGGPPPRNMAPPPGFFAPPPPGFMPPPGMGGFQGPEALAYAYDGRGMPPPGAGGGFRRN